VAGSGTLDRLVETARDYAKHAASENTLKAYAKDWAHFSRWCRMKGTEPLPPSPEMIGLYLADLAAPIGKVQRDNQDENAASIRMRTRVWGRAGRA